MEFRDLKRQYQLHKEQIDFAIMSTLAQAEFINGKPVRQLEEKLEEYVGVRNCIACANGTDALLLALVTWGIGEGDAVFVPDFTFFSSAEVIPTVKATPVFVDVDENTYNINVDSLEKAIRYVLESTNLIPKVIIAVDLFGQPADYNRIRKIADKYGLLILEDAAQGFGGKFEGREACSFGDIAITSFFPAKPLGCYGDGGALFTDCDEWAETLRSLQVHGKGEDKYDNVRIGMNSRLDTLQAAILNEKLSFFNEEIECCNKIAESYTELLRNDMRTPVIKPQMYSSWAQYTIRLKDDEQRTRVIKHLKENGIPTAIYYKKPLHVQKALEQYYIEELDCNISEKICSTCVSLPMHPYLKEWEIEEICHKLLAML